jgi:putative beta-lysine N-acetyltransferase
MYDVIEQMGESLIQHGEYNNRIYLMKLSTNDYPDLLKTLDQLALEKSYTKIFAKIPSWLSEGIESEGYSPEAKIPYFYNGTESMSFVSKFLDNNRAVISIAEKEKIDHNLDLAQSKKNSVLHLKKNPSFTLKKLDENDIPNLSKLYSKVFKSYPFPIFENKYLKKTMSENIIYFGYYDRNKLVAASSAEMDAELENAEMTDFATDPKYLGNNLSLLLLREMENEMIRKNIKTVYTIARSLSAGMNITFAKQNYEYSGTLINNTNISGKIESMNVWHKNLSN